MNIKTNSKKVKKRDIFIALKGDKYDGHDYIKEAISNGASKIICENCDFDFPCLVVQNTHEYLKNYVYNKYYKKIKDIKLIGITGTNGKTTSCFLVYQMLLKLKVKCAYIGTIGFYIDKKIRDLDNTTPDLVTMYELLLECRKNNVEYVVMEVSSHALKKERLYGLKFDVVAFTNLTQDHLDFHKNMIDYLNSKRKLFDMTFDNSVSVVNIDDDYSKFFLKDNTITMGFNNSSYQILSYKLYLNKTTYTFRYNNKVYNVKIKLPGKYNIYNSMLAIIIINNIGFKLNKILKTISKINSPKGRSEVIQYGSNYIIVDYAHTPDAIKNILNSVCEFKKSKVYTIVGCGGNRDKSKRSGMGEIATNLSDYVIFTNDNPRFEDPYKIVDDIVSNLSKDNYEIILDRSLAIKKGISYLKKKDILLILGKGHESYQIVNDTKKHFDDCEEVLRYIKK